MTTPNVVALKAELEAALAVLNPQIKGMQDLIAIPGISPELQGELTGQQAEHQRRATVVSNALNALTALEADGYPDLPKEDLSPAAFAELQLILSDIKAASGEFEAAPPASEVVVTLPGVAEK